MPNVNHIALLQFKPTVTPSQASEIMAELRGLQHKIPQIRGYTAGLNNSPEGLNQGLTHGFIMTFSSAADRDAYLIHPEHEKVKARALPLVQNVLVFDFEDDTGD